MGLQKSEGNPHPAECFLSVCSYLFKSVEKPASVSGALCSVWPSKYVGDHTPLEVLVTWTGEKSKSTEPSCVTQVGAWARSGSQTREAEMPIPDRHLGLLRGRPRLPSLPVPHWPCLPDLTTLHMLLPKPPTLFPQFIAARTPALPSSCHCLSPLLRTPPLTDPTTLPL